MILYIAGQMSGIRHFNYPAFFSAAEKLRAEGYAVVNPPERDAPEVQHAALDSERGYWADLPYPAEQLLPEIIQQNVDDVLSSDGLAMLPGWEHSRGARFEVALAERIGLDIRSLEQWL